AGALVVTFSAAPESIFAQRLDGASSNQLDGWISINADGSITGYTGKCELGHGLYTAQTQLIAEELSVSFNRVKLIQCDPDLTLNPRARRKPASEWSILGTPVPRIEIPAMATGEFEYVHNVRVPGMLHGQVVRPPVVGSTLVSVDENSVKDLPGVVKVVVKKNFLGVVAQKPWQAIQAANKLKALWT